MIKFALSIVSTGYCLAGLTQEQPMVFSFLPEDYEASPQNWSVASNEHGLVTGNSSGVLIYDGEHWGLHPLPGNHRVRAICVKNDTIFCGGYGEFGYWLKTKTASYVYHSLNEGLDFPLSEQEEIWNIEAYENGVLFQSFSTIYLYEQESISIIPSPFSSGIMFLFRIEDSLVFQAIGSGLAKLSPDREITMLPGTDQLSEMSVSAIQPYGDGLLIATEKHGLFTYRAEQLVPLFPELTPLLQQSQVNKLLINDENIIVGTIVDGLYVLDHAGHIQHHFSIESGLPDNTVLSLALSQDGGLWVGFDYGLTYIDLNSPYSQFIDREGKLGVVFCALETDDALFLGSNHGLFRHTFGESGFEIISGTEGQVWSLIRSPSGEIYCGHNKGTLAIDGDSARQIGKVTGPWSWLREEEQERFLQGTYTGVVAWKDHSSLSALGRMPGLSAPIRDLVKDSLGHVWGVHPYKGLYRFTLSNDSILQLQESLEEWGLPDDNRLRMMNVSGTIIVRSDSGWYELDQSLIQFRRMESFCGIPLRSESIRFFECGESLLLLEKDQIVISRSGQLVVIPTRNLPEDPFVLQMRNGHFLVGVSQGYLVIDPTNIKPNTLPIPFASSISILADSSVLPYPFWATESPSIVLESHQRGIQIDFSSGFLPLEQFYRHRITGIQESNSPWSSKASLTIPLLPFGETVINIERKSDGKILTITCYKEFPWYLRKWAVLLFILFTGILIYGLLRQYQMMLMRKWRRQQVEAQRAKHAREIEEKNVALESEVKGQNQELAGITMNLVRKNELILELKERLQAIQKNPESTSIRSIILSLNSQLSQEKDWEAFEYHFTRVHQGFFTKLKKDFPGLTSGDLRLAAYLRMNLSSKEIAPLLHISLRSLENKRYRLRKKLQLQPGQQIIDLLLTY